MGMKEIRSAVHIANAARAAKGKKTAKPPEKPPASKKVADKVPAKAEKPARRKKVGRPKKRGPKKGKWAVAMRQRKKALEDEKPEFLPKFDLFLDYLARGDTHRDAMDKAGLEWPIISRQMAADDTLRDQHAAAKALREEFWKEERLDSMHKRGVTGVSEPMVSAGKLVCDKTVYSDACLLKLAVADNPDKFADRSKVDHNVTGRSIDDVVADLESESSASKAKARGGIFSPPKKPDGSTTSPSAPPPPVP